MVNSSTGIVGEYSLNSNLSQFYRINQYTSSSTISIDENADFEIYPGEGTFSNPYIISNLEIISSNQNLIDIRNTDVNFIVENNYLSGDSADAGVGVAFLNVENGIIRNNNIMDATGGITLVNSQNNRIDFNRISNHDQTGIFMSNSPNNVIWHNIIEKNHMDGISLDFSHDNSFSNNSILANNNKGVVFVSSVSNYFERSYVSRNNLAGISLHGSSENIFQATRLSLNGIGIEVLSNNLFEGSNNNFILDNTIESNLAGLVFEESNTNTVSRNSINLNVGNAIDLQASNDIKITQNHIFGNSIAILNHHSLRSTSMSNSIEENNQGIVYGIDSRFSIAHHNSFQSIEDYAIQIVESSNSHNISVNDFIGNGQIPQVRDDGVNNTINGNYWNDNGDNSNYNDIIYEINGESGNQDLNPQNSKNLVEGFIRSTISCLETPSNINNSSNSSDSAKNSLLEQPTLELPIDSSLVLILITMVIAASIVMVYNTRKH